MTRDTDRPANGPAGPSAGDDEPIARLVRAVADDWRMPPQRLDQPTWRDRVGDSRGRRPRGWFARLAGPAGTAVLATVIVAFVAVWLTAPRSTPGTAISSPSGTAAAPTVSAAPTGSAAPSTPTSPRPSASGLPALSLNGALPAPSRVTVQAGDVYRVADLATGTIGDPSFARYSGPTTLVATPDGWSCVCGSYMSSTASGMPSSLVLKLATVKPDGTPGATTPIRTLQGEPDPTTSVDFQGGVVDSSAVGSADGRFAFVGWAVRKGASGWSAGIDVVDTLTGTVLQSLHLPTTEPTAAGGRAISRSAPLVSPSPTSSMTVLISSSWYVDGESFAVPPSGTDHWTASIDAWALSKPTPVGSTDGTDCGEAGSGFIDAARYYVVCVTSSGAVTIDRRSVDGTRIDRTLVSTSSGLELGSLVVRQADRLFVWDPLGMRLSRFDLHTAVVDDATGTAVAPTTSPLDGLAALGRQVGRWLAPPVAAKVLIRPGLVASADGTRIYGLGIESLSGDGSGGSRGIYAFDAETLAPIGHWAPTADLQSIAISPDGRFVYAAAPSGVDANGDPAQNAASITVFDTTDGSVRLLAGNLGGDTLYFPDPVAR